MLPMLTFLDRLEAAHKGKGTLPPEMISIEILRETGMSFTEQRKQPAHLIELLVLDIVVKRRVDKAAIARAERKGKRKGKKG